jgi:hypothetical protein
MAIGPQLFGVIAADNESSEAMLCMDADRPDELLIQWWSEQGKPGALLFKVKSPQVDTFELSPLAVYQVGETGGLWAPPKLTTEDRSPLVESEVCSTWADFKKWASWSREKMDAVAYRGHGSNKFRLQTTLHRAGRRRLERYCSDTLQEFRSHVEADLGERIDMNNGDDYSMVLGLAQHHGLPTPLLDLSGSPYIAAFFAFSDALEFSETRAEVSHVRVYGFTRDFLSGTSTPKVTLPYFKPYTSSLSISPRRNRRLYAQQGQFLVTNVADVEPFICGQERRIGTKCLIAADIPVSCALEALEDLAFVGLTAATMFPELDGVCRMLKHTMAFRGKPAPPAPKLVDGGDETEPLRDTSENEQLLRGSRDRK